MNKSQSILGYTNDRKRGHVYSETKKIKLGSLTTGNICNIVFFDSAENFSGSFKSSLKVQRISIHSEICSIFLTIFNSSFLLIIQDKLNKGYARQVHKTNTRQVIELIFTMEL